uniref:fumarylacetoacetate hydrolase family protein n=1 Tax=Pontiella sp. TaxID=2837462 RepID=UPI0035667A27
LGPFLVTPDEVPGIENRRVWQRCNDDELQNGNTGDMIFSIPYLIEYISKGMTLYPGDIISTGTPAGIGSARDPQVLLKSGDVVEAGVDGVGAQRVKVV